MSAAAPDTQPYPLGIPRRAQEETAKRAEAEKRRAAEAAAKSVFEKTPFSAPPGPVKACQWDSGALAPAQSSCQAAVDNCAPQVAADERAAFEAWAKTEYVNTDRWGSSGQYCDDLVEDYWGVWQASRAATPPAPAIAQPSGKAGLFDATTGETDA